MTYKFQRNQAIMSGGLDQEGSIQVMDQAGSKQLKLNDDGTLSGSALATLHSITSGDGNFTVSALGAVETAAITATGVVSSSAAGNFLSLDLNGNAAIDSAGAATGLASVVASGLGDFGSLTIDNTSTFGVDGDTDMLTFTQADNITVAADLSFVITVGKLELGDGNAVAATAAQIDYTTVGAIGTADASKALVLDASKDIAGINQLSATGLSGALQYKYKPEANGGISADTFQNDADVVNVKLSGSALASEAVSVSANSLLHYNSAGAAKIMTISSLATAMAGAGITATNGVFSADSAGTPTLIVNNQDLVEGLNYAADLAAAWTVDLPAAPTVGDTVTAKAKALTGSGKITISGQGSHLIDGEASVAIESTYGAISFVYAAANDWRIV